MLFDGDAIVLAGATGRVGGATLRLSTMKVRASRSFRARRRRPTPRSTAWIERLASWPISPTPTASRRRSTTSPPLRTIDAVVNLAGRGKFVAFVDSTLDDLRVNLDGSSCPLTISRSRRCDAC